MCAVAGASVGCDDPATAKCAKGEDIGRSTFAAYTSISDENGSIAMQVSWPIRDAGDERWPVAVVIPGAFTTDEIAQRATQVGVDNDVGVVSIQVDLAGKDWFNGEDDLRGPISRRAVALASRYAAGEIDDDDGCHLSDRSPAALTENVVLVGLSNGGNLAAATLADSTLDLPPIIGWVPWETPAGAQFVNLEHRNDDRLYSPGTCIFESSGVVCPYDVTTLAAGPDGYCFDLDSAGTCDEADIAVTGRLHPDTNLQLVSPTLALLAQNAGIDAANVADLATVTNFWAERDASALAATAIALHPDLAIILLASEIDHVLDGLGDHPHVFGLGEALQNAGARWTRLNPGVEWSGHTDENEVNAPLRLSAASAWLTPEVGAALEAELSAAVREISDRKNADLW